jgi:hypothetical protein
MYFDTKSYLKITHNHTAKHSLNSPINLTSSTTKTYKTFVQ